MKNNNNNNKTKTNKTPNNAKTKLQTNSKPKNFLHLNKKIYDKMWWNKLSIINIILQLLVVSLCTILSETEAQKFC